MNRTYAFFIQLFMMMAMVVTLKRYPSTLSYVPGICMCVAFWLGTIVREDGAK